MEFKDDTIRLKQLMERILHRDYKGTEEFCQNTMFWNLNGIYGSRSEIAILLNSMPEVNRKQMEGSSEIRKVHHLKLSHGLVQSSCIVIASKWIYELFVTFINGKVAFINITEIDMEKEEPVYRIRACNAECYLMKEREIIYLESSHNRVLWHCRGKLIATNDSLGHFQEKLSEAFVRIQRGYLVNKNHACHVRRCEVQMSNGDILSIPDKKYVIVREQLFQKKGV